MWIDSTLYLFMLLIRCLFFFATLFVTHIVIADAAVMGALAYVMPEVLSLGLPDGARNRRRQDPFRSVHPDIHLLAAGNHHVHCHLQDPIGNENESMWPER